MIRRMRVTRRKRPLSLVEGEEEIAALLALEADIAEATWTAEVEQEMRGAKRVRFKPAGDPDELIW